MQSVAGGLSRSSFRPAGIVTKAPTSRQLQTQHFPRIFRYSSGSPLNLTNCWTGFQDVGRIFIGITLPRISGKKTIKKCAFSCIGSADFSPNTYKMATE
jgi:hypothetical protein